MPSRRPGHGTSGKSQAESIDISSGEDDFEEVEVDTKPYGRASGPGRDSHRGMPTEEAGQARRNGGTASVTAPGAEQDGMEAREAIKIALAKLDAEVSPCFLGSQIEDKC